MLLPLLAATLAVPPAADRKPPEFRAEARMIRLDVSVVDRRGRPVAGLNARDFRVTENGRPVEIALFEAVEPVSPGVTVTPEGAEASVDQRPPRRTVLLVDASRMSQGQLGRSRDAVSRFLRETTGLGDWVQLINLSTGRSWDGSIPDDRLRLESAARGLVRGASLWAELGSPSDAIVERAETDASMAGYSETSTSGQFLSAFAETSGLLGTLESILVQLRGVEGRKALVLLSPGFPQLRDLRRRLERVSSLAREASTSVYFVDAFGLDGLTPEPGQALAPAFEAAWSRSGGSQDLAEATGGFTSRFSNSLHPALRKVIAEMRTYYVVGYVPSGPDDGRFRSVRVKVDVPGVMARTKKGYIADGR